MSRPEVVSIPRALAVGEPYHQVRTQALDTVVALSAIAGDSARHPGVHAELQQAKGDAHDASWWPLDISTSRSELAQVVGGRRRRPEAIDRELDLLASTRDPDGEPLASVVLGSTRRLEVTISAWWNRGVRRGSAHTYLVLDDYRQLDAVGRRGYAWLAGWAGIGGGSKPRTIRVDTLAGHLWADPPTTPAARWQRLARTRQVIEELGVLRGTRWYLVLRGDQVAVGPLRGQDGHVVLAQAPDGPTGRLSGALATEDLF